MDRIYLSYFDDVDVVLFVFLLVVVVVIVLTGMKLKIKCHDIQIYKTIHRYVY